MDLGKQAVLQLKGKAAVWVMHYLSICMSIEWSTFGIKLKAMYVLPSPLDLVKCKWEEKNLGKGEHVTKFTEHFYHLGSQLNPHQPVPTEGCVGNKVYIIEISIHGAYQACI